MLRLVLRPLLVIVTLGAVLVALSQVVGRITFAFLEHLEPAANRLLADRGISLHGLSGDWRMLNPIVRVERIELPAGELTGLELETDVLESVVRGTLLARRLKVDGVELALTKHPGEPWRLRGAANGTELDVSTFLEESNQLEVDGRLVLYREGFEPAAIELSYLGTNRGGVHRHALELNNPAAECASDCALRVDFQRLDRLWPLRPGRARFTATSDGFLLPRPLLGISPLELAQLDVSWQQNAERSAGTMRARAEQLDMPGDVTVAMELAGALSGFEGVHTGSVSSWQVEQGDEVWQLPDVAVSADADGFSLWMPILDLSRASRFLQHALSAVGPAERWLDALGLHGSVRNVRLAYGFDGAGLSYAATLDRVGLDGYKGVPTVRNAQGELFGFEHGVQLELNAQDMTLEFPDVFTARWQLPYAQGVLQAWFGRDYFGVRGLHLRAEANGTRAAGQFAVTRPPDREGQRLMLLASTDRIPVAQAQEFVPYKLPEELQDWLLTAPLGGVLEDARVAYQGQFQEEPGELARRVELAAHVVDGHIRYHPDWPEVQDLTGDLAVAGSLVEMEAERAWSAGARLGGSEVRVVDNAAAVDVSLDAEADGDAVLDFLRTTPLAGWVEFVEPDWQASGPMRLSGEIHVPLNDAVGNGDVAVRLRADLHGVDLDLPGYRVALETLDGSVRYRHPYHLDAAGVTGELFGAPVTLGADTRGERVYLTFAGRATPDDVWQMIEMDDPGVASGAFDFTAELGIGVAEDAVAEMVVSSSLAGAGIGLPAGYGKTADEETPAEVQVRFLPDYRAVAFRYRDAAGWLHVGEAPAGEAPRAGAIRFGVAGRGSGEGAVARLPAVPGPGEAPGYLALLGRVDGFLLEDVVPDGDGNGDGTGGGLPLPIHLDGLEAGEIGIGGFTLTNATLNGDITDEGFTLSVDSTEVAGAAVKRGDAPMQVTLARVQVPSGEGDAAPSDPLDPDVIADLPDADVVIDRLTVGRDEYGSWRFALRPQHGNLDVTDLEARVRGVTIHAPEGLLWRGDVDETLFHGTLTAGNLAEVLPQWGYAASVETGAATLTGAFTWSGSPLMVDLLALRGEAEAHAERGRFLDVESGAGAQKIFSLLNFTAIAKRVSLNFSDVFGRGVSFDTLNANFMLDEGLLEFLEPMQVEGTGSSFRVTGSVDLEDGRLDNDMIVTLPVTKSLPWYAAYVALANPLAGLGVLVGERMLRKPLEQFSSARYHIGGTLDEPNVTFESVFDVTPVEAPAAGGGPPEQGGSTAGSPPPSDPPADAQPAQADDDRQESD